MHNFLCVTIAIKILNYVGNFYCEHANKHVVSHCLRVIFQQSYLYIRSVISICTLEIIMYNVSKAPFDINQSISVKDIYHIKFCNTQLIHKL